MNLNRRQCLKAAGLASGASLLGSCEYASSRKTPAGAGNSPLTADALERAASRKILDVSGIDSPLVIESIRLLRKDRDYIVHVRSKGGAEGVSLTNTRAEYVYPILNKRVIPFFIGKDARDYESLQWELYRHQSNYKLQGLAFWCCVAWVEFAILDMLGRAQGRSIGDILGGVIRRNVRFYVASGRRDSTPQEEVEYLQGLVDETGAEAVKFRLGGRMSKNADASPGRSEGLIRLSRKYLGDSIDLHGDANSSYDPPEAIRIGKMLEDVGAVYFEEPCPFDHLEDTRRVADALTIDVAGGEQEFSRRRFRWMIQNRGVDIVQPDLHYYGGLLRSIRVARMAALANMPTTVHISGGFGFIYMLHFASVTPDIGKYQEYKRGIEKYLNWFDPVLKIKNGALTVPQGPGVGIKDIRALLKGAKPVS
ncbi:MAG: mandelate racemase/muconate lactonizing enzyme family protein [Planctomycetes bacterium]|nr:mandelate racemase/muconate lactonizing enzyme family protein [Planctomycetota bacterium]